MLPVLEREKEQIDRSFYLGYGSIVSSDGWKLVKANGGNPRMKLQKDALFNIMEDPGEQIDLREEFPEVYKRLKQTVARLDAIKPQRQVKPYNHGREDFKAPREWKIVP